VKPVTRTVHMRGATATSSEDRVMQQALLSGAAIGALYVLMTLGFALSLEIADIVNIAHGAFVVGGMYLTLELTRHGLDVYLAALVSAAVVGAFAYPIYVLFMRPARAESGHRVQLVFSLLIFSALTAVYQLLFSADVQAIGRKSKTVSLLGGYLTVAQLLAIVLAVVISLALYYVAHNTLLGKVAYVASLYPLGARSIGVPVQRIYTAVFVLSGALAGLAGAIIVTFQPVKPTLGLEFNVVVFLVALVARTNLLWCLVLGLTYGIVQSALSYSIDASLAATLTLVIFLIALVAEHAFKSAASAYQRLFRRQAITAGAAL
jgi:branched-chain amino acid transport system permease protein